MAGNSVARYRIVSQGCDGALSVGDESNESETTRIAAALDAPPGAEIAHLDLEPPGFFVTVHGDPGNLDLGLAKASVPATSESGSVDAPTVAGEFRPAVGTTVGTVACAFLDLTLEIRKATAEGMFSLTSSGESFSGLTVSDLGGSHAVKVTDEGTGTSAAVTRTGPGSP